MKSRNDRLIMQNRIFGWLAIGTLILLLIPYLMIQYHIPIFDPGSGMEELNWSLFDFAAMGALIFGISSISVIVARVVPQKYRKVLAVGFFFFFVWLWAELSVGVFTNLGS